MKVLDLRCEAGHGFEGWFASEADFASQLASGLVTCPVCGERQVRKVPSAPRLNLHVGCSAGSTERVSERRGEGDGPRAHGEASAPVQASEELAVALRAMRQWVSQCRDVGEAFAAHALAIHRGELEPEAIRGRATAEQARELAEEGVKVMPLPDWPALTEPLQ